MTKAKQAHEQTALLTAAPGYCPQTLYTQRHAAAHVHLQTSPATMLPANNGP